MIRNLKALGLVLVAIFAMSAIVASAAMAGQGELTSDGKVKLTGTDEVESPATLGALGKTVSCHGHYTVGNVNETPHGFLSPPVTTMTVAPDYTDCTAPNPVNPSVPLTATVTLNGCDYVLHIGTGTSPTYSGTADIVCPGSSVIEVHVYQETDTAHTKTPICTDKIGPQTGKTGATVTNEGGNLKLAGTITGLKVKQEGVLCGGTKETETGTETVSTIIEGTNEEGGATSVEISG
jgi:hypothetical protein